VFLLLTSLFFAPNQYILGLIELFAHRVYAIRNKRVIGTSRFAPPMHSFGIKKKSDIKQRNLRIQDSSVSQSESGFFLGQSILND